MASIVSTLLNINRKKGKSPVTPADVLGKSKPRKIVSKSPDQVVAMMRRVVAATGGTIKHLDTND